jgi:hypothetical protein
LVPVRVRREKGERSHARAMSDLLMQEEFVD